MPVSPVRVTFVFHDDEQLHHFLDKNNIDTYTYNWKKGEYLIDLSGDVKESIKTVAAEPVKEQPASVVSEFI
jgi:hypothetical protein